MITRSKTLKDRFSELVERFSTWAEKQEDRINGEIETLKRDIRNLEDKIAKLTVAVDTLGAVLGATIGIGQSIQMPSPGTHRGSSKHSRQFSAGVAAALGPAAIPTILVSVWHWTEGKNESLLKRKVAVIGLGCGICGDRARGSDRGPRCEAG